MTFVKGQQRPAGSGRRAGTPNQATAAFKRALEAEVRRRGGWKQLMAGLAVEDLMPLLVRAFLPREARVEAEIGRTLADILRDSWAGETPPQPGERDELAAGVAIAGDGCNADEASAPVAELKLPPAVARVTGVNGSAGSPGAGRETKSAAAKLKALRELQGG